MLHPKKNEPPRPTLNTRLAGRILSPAKTWGGAAPSIRSSVQFYEKLIAPLGTGIISPASSSPNPSPPPLNTRAAEIEGGGGSDGDGGDSEGAGGLRIAPWSSILFILALVSSSSSSASYVRYLKINQQRPTFSRGPRPNSYVLHAQLGSSRIRADKVPSRGRDLIGLSISNCTGR